MSKIEVDDAQRGPDGSTLAEWIRPHLEAPGQSRAKLAALLGMNVESISRWSNGHRTQMSFSAATRWKTIMGIDVPSHLILGYHPPLDTKELGTRAVLARCLCARQLAKGLSLAELSRSTGVYQGQLRQYAQGLRKRVSRRVANKLALVLGPVPEYLIQ